ncbi:MAG TPA: hypothetical protein VEH05_05735 [Streptosporangiaceae bacterium]|nr:hypothetical protein [Streptosporangiaceae bacterium]
MTTGVDILRAAYAGSGETLRRVLAGSSAEEFFGEPVAADPTGETAGRCTGSSPP